MSFLLSIPKTGETLPLDGLMLQVAVHDNHPAGRHLRLLAADLVFVLSVINELARKAGHTLACAEDAQRLLAEQSQHQNRKLREIGAEIVEFDRRRRAADGAAPVTPSA